MALLHEGSVAYSGTPDALIDQAKGHVWLLKATEVEYHEINEKYPVISTIPVDGGWEIQVVAPELKGYTGTPLEPNLEHAYVYFMESKIGQWTND